LAQYAKEEWWRTAPQLHVLGLLSSVDVACLAAYCAASDMVRYAGEFGLTPVARTRIAQGIQQPPPSKFDGLLAGPQK
jgi:phage terminase small subunit